MKIAGKLPDVTFNLVMPLDSQAPSGLLVFYQATARGKMIITSDTVTTREYFSDGKGILCDNNIDNWVEKINYYLEHEDEAKEMNQKCHAFLMDRCSVGQFQSMLGGLAQDK